MTDKLSVAADSSPSELGRSLPLTPAERSMWDRLCTFEEYPRRSYHDRYFGSEKVILCRLRQKLRESGLPFRIVNIRRRFLKLERIQ